MMCGTTSYDIESFDVLFQDFFKISTNAHCVGALLLGQTLVVFAPLFSNLLHHLQRSFGMLVV